MAVVLNVETGAGNDPSCNAYLSLAEVSAYHEEMGNTAWAAAAASPDNLRNAAIVRACRAIDRLYGGRFIGRPTNYGVQALQWPRTGATVRLPGYQSVDGAGSSGFALATDLIPVEVKKACCEAALIELSTPGSMTPDLERGGKIKAVSAGAVSVTFEDGASAKTVRTAIDGILSLLLTTPACEVVLG